MNLKEKLKKITSENHLDWLEEAGKKLTNSGSRKNARKVALRVLHILKEQGISQTRLAEMMGVSRQQITKIVKGKENFTFETIDKLEKALDITLMTINSSDEHTTFNRKSLQAVVPLPPGHLRPLMFGGSSGHPGSSLPLFISIDVGMSQLGPAFYMSPALKIIHALKFIKPTRISWSAGESNVFISASGQAPTTKEYKLCEDEISGFVMS